MGVVIVFDRKSPDGTPLPQHAPKVYTPLPRQPRKAKPHRRAAYLVPHLVEVVDLPEVVAGEERRRSRLQIVPARGVISEG